LQGFERFLRKYPEWRRQVQLLLVVVPSRTEVERYDRMKRRIDELIGKLNGEFSVPGWTPVVYQYRSLSMTEIVAVYAAGDVALITPLRDGMNLVAKEYVAARTDGTGVLILSEMAGASREMGEAWIITPTTSEETADALKAALDMPPEDQARRLHAMQARLRDYDVVRWGEDFMHQLRLARDEQARFGTRLLRDRTRASLIDAYRNARRRLLLLDYDGTLVPFEGRPDTARPSTALLATLERLEDDPRDEVVVISGRPRDTLDTWLGPVGVSMVAEHGAWIRKGEEPWRLVKPLRSDWKAQILPLLKASADRLQGAFVEEKEYALVWHYREADIELASLREKELVDSLVQLTANLDVTVTQGNRMVEVRNAGVSKGSAAVEFLGSGDFDFVLAIGDDATDEDLFKAIPESAFSIRVGIAGSRARFNVADHGEVLRLLQDLAETRPAENAAEARRMVQSGE
jgi:trehalose 6-phosphate synthase/phosphatase